jgi:beta-N-acetylhexosaminidase
MTAHVVIPEWDNKPVTQSEKGIKRIRETFGDRIIVSDCLTMGAIKGSIEERVTETLDAGVDLALFSNGSDAERRRAVTASGEPRVTREDPLALSYFPPAVLQQLLETLAKVDFDRTLTDPTWDQPN